jgi:hypothetical protein
MVCRAGVLRVLRRILRAGDVLSQECFCLEESSKVEDESWAAFSNMK